MGAGSKGSANFPDRRGLLLLGRLIELSLAEGAAGVKGFAYTQRGMARNCQRRSGSKVTATLIGLMLHNSITGPREDKWHDPCNSTVIFLAPHLRDPVGMTIGFNRPHLFISLLLGDYGLGGETIAYYLDATNRRFAELSEMEDPELMRCGQDMKKPLPAEVAAAIEELSRPKEEKVRPLAIALRASSDPHTQKSQNEVIEKFC